MQAFGKIDFEKTNQKTDQPKYQPSWFDKVLARVKKDAPIRSVDSQTGFSSGADLKQVEQKLTENDPPPELLERDQKVQEVIGDTVKNYPEIPTDVKNTMALEGLRESIREEVKKVRHDINDEATKELTKDSIKSQKAGQRKLDAMVKDSFRVLLQITAVFPFDLFPDEVIIDLTQVNTIEKDFWGSERRHTSPIKNIDDVYVYITPFFASLQIVDSSVKDQPITIKNLWPEDAKKARRIIQGLIIAEKEGISLSSLDDKDLNKKIEELGRMREEKKD